jgi:hypothetical protein
VDRVVIGAGPIGLVAAYILDVDAVVAERPGGSDLRRFAPTYLWRSEATETLLDDLGLPAEPRIVRFGYLGDDGIQEEFSDEDRIEYYRRSRGIDPGAPVEVPTSAMSSAMMGEIETFDVSVDDVVAALLHHVDVTVGRVLAVEVSRTDGRTTPRLRIAISGEREIWAERVVNTLPAPVWDSVVRHDDGHHRAAAREWPTGVKTFLRIPAAALSGELRKGRDDGLSFVYVVSSDRVRYMYDRVNFVDDDAILEFNRPEAVPTGGDWDRLERYVVRVQVRGPGRDPVEYAGAVWHLGRFARWLNSIRIHDVLRDLYEDGG